MKRHHNKKRNSALLYEFLIKRISKCLLENKKEEAGKALEISKKYFSEGMPLKDELNLFNAVTKTTVKSEDSARKILDIVCNASSKQNARKLDEQKSKLIKDINYTFKDESFYDAKVLNYQVLASLQTLLNESRTKVQDLSKVERVKLEDSVVQFLIKEDKLNVPKLETKPEYSNTVYNFVVNRFNKKYEGKLSESQKRLLTKYAASQISGKDKDLKSSISAELSKISIKLKGIKDESIIKDKDLMKNISECSRKMSEINIENVDDKSILEVLQYMKLVEELES